MSDNPIIKIVTEISEQLRGQESDPEPERVKEMIVEMWEARGISPEELHTALDESAAAAAKYNTSAATAFLSGMEVGYRLGARAS